METAEPMQTVKKHRFTVEEFHKMGEVGIFGEDDRVELIDGEVVETSPPGRLHAWCVRRVTLMLVRFAEARRSRSDEDYEVGIQDPLVTGEHGRLQPDAMLIKSVPPTRLPNFEDVLLVIEVSDTTLTYDKNIKLPRYAASGIPEVWIFDVQAKTIEVHSEPTPDGYRKTIRYKRNDHIESATIPGLAFAARDVVPPEDKDWGSETAR